MSLTAKDQDILTRALDLAINHCVGIFPTCSKQMKQFYKLQRWGLLKFNCIGRDIDGEIERDVRIYCLTEKGFSLAKIIETLV